MDETAHDPFGVFGPPDGGPVAGQADAVAKSTRDPFGVLDLPVSHWDQVATYSLLTACIAYGALCLWLTVRIVNRRERWAKWTLAVFVVSPLLYVLSFGPACWWFSNEHGVPGSDFMVAPAIYLPIGRVLREAGFNTRVGSAIAWYATRRHSHVMIPCSSGGQRIVIMQK